MKDLLKNLKPEEKSEILEWLNQAEAIRNDGALTEAQKRAKIGELKSSQIILKFLKLGVDQFAGQSQMTKNIVEGVAGGGAALLAARYVKTVGVALLGARLALPYIMMTEKFGELITYLKARLQEPITG